jgi:hypothetical protein
MTTPMPCYIAQYNHSTMQLLHIVIVWNAAATELSGMQLFYNTTTAGSGYTITYTGCTSNRSIPKGVHQCAMFSQGLAECSMHDTYVWGAAAAQYNLEVKLVHNQSAWGAAVAQIMPLAQHRSHGMQC